MKSSKIINTIAETALGVYLFSENPILGTILWYGILEIKVVYCSPMFILYFFISVLSLFIIGALVDILRIKLLEETIFNKKITYYRQQYRY